MVEIVAVERADIVEAQLLEQRAAGGEAARETFCAPGHGLQAFREILGQLLRDMAKAAIGLRRDQLGQAGAQGTHRRGDRHVVVVEDHHQPRALRAGIVHRLIGHAGAHRPVADHRDHVAVVALEPGRGGHAEPGRDRGRAVRGAERVVIALRAPREARQPARLAQRADALAAAGDDLVRVALMADVPDQPVVWRVEHMVQRHGQLDHAQPGAEMPARHRDRVDRLLAQLRRELLQLRPVEAAQVRWRKDLVEERRRQHRFRELSGPEL